MKTAISIPDPIFEKAERLAARMQRSRSDLYSQAIAEYVARHSFDELTEAMNEALADMDSNLDPFAQGVSRRTLERSEW